MQTPHAVTDIRHGNSQAGGGSSSALVDLGSSSGRRPMRCSRVSTLGDRSGRGGSPVPRSLCRIVWRTLFGGLAHGKRAFTVSRDRRRARARRRRKTGAIPEVRDR